MNKYTDHEHSWQVEVNSGGILFVKCKECALKVELYTSHLVIADYTIKDKNKLTLREVLSYDELIK